MLTLRDIRLFGLAHAYGLDTTELERIGARQGVDVYTTDWDTVWRVLTDELATPPVSADEGTDV